MGLLNKGIKSLIIITLITGMPTLAYAEFFSNFEEAEEEALQVEAAQVNTDDASGDLGTGKTVKTVSDYVGLAGVTAVIGATLYDWTDEERAELEELDKQYQTALTTGDTSSMESIQRQVDEIHAKRTVAAKDQAETQEAIADIQNAGALGLAGAGIGSLAAATLAHIAKKKLEAANKTLEAANKTQLDHDQGAGQAAETATEARNSAVIMGVAELAAAYAGKKLADSAQESADDLNSIADDPRRDLDPEVAQQIFQIEDQIALEECGTGQSYTMAQPPTPATFDPGAPRNTGDPSVSEYQDILDRVICIGPSAAADGSTGGGSSVATN